MVALGDSVTKYVVSEVGTDVVTKPGFDLNTWVAPHIKFAKQAVPIWIKAVRAEFGVSHAFLVCYILMYVLNSVDAPGTQWATIGLFGDSIRNLGLTLFRSFFLVQGTASGRLSSWTFWQKTTRS